MTEQNIWIAIIVAFTTICTTMIGPLLTTMLVNRERRRDRKEDFARQDQVAKLAASTSESLLTATESAAEDQNKIKGKLDVIHTLVNSKMTEEMQGRLESLRRELALAIELAELKKATGKKPSIEITAAMESTRQKIAELETALAERIPPPAPV